METVFADILRELQEKAPQMLVAIGVLAILTGVGHIVALGVGRIVGRGDRNDRYARLTRRLVRWAFTLFGVLLALQILGYTAVATSMLATGGVAAVVLGFAFKEIGENMLAGIFLAFSRSFDVGDLIESDGLRGVVRQIDLRATHIRTADGCDIFIPSSLIFRQPLHNFTRDGLRRASFTIGVDYGDDPSSALGVMRDAVAGTRGVLGKPAPTFELADFVGSWVDLGAHLWVNTQDPEKADASLSQVRTRAMAAARAALLEAGFRLSADTTTSLAVRPVHVRMDTVPAHEPESDPRPDSGV
jgi:small-conductance mechanosensitive channel